MPEPLKNIYSPTFFENFTASLQKTMPSFEKQRFLNHVFDRDWESRELKQRMRHISTVLAGHLPGHFRQQVKTVLSIIDQLQQDGIKGGFEYMFIPDFIEQYGLHDPGISLQAMEEITKFVSCEFAIRPFLLQYPEKVMQQMLKWSRHPHHHVRRFSSEGCRPRLPWAMAIPALKKDPASILPVLENLKNDESTFVRKSVANNLNDIAKDHPDIVVELVKSWKGTSPETDWIIKHGCRTLLKNAHASTYRLFGLKRELDCEIADLKISQARLKIGDRLRFSFRLKSPKATRLRLEYAVYYAKSGGRQSRKIFQLAEKNFTAGDHSISKEQRFQDFTTRKHYPGKHRISIVVNGKELASKDFMLLQ